MKNCPVCGNDIHIQILKLKDIPVNTNTLLINRDLALKSPLGDIDLRFCKECTHLFNGAFESKKVVYGSGYENCLFYSSRFRNYVEEQIGQLVNQYSLMGKTIIEVGSGNGEYLEHLCKRGGAYGIGFDLRSSKKFSDDGRLRFFKENFRKDLIEKRPYLIISRQTLEHIPNPKNLVNEMKESIEERQGKVFIEVPNGLHILKENRVWDLIYEHVSYFTPQSITRLFNECGFKVASIKENFGNQYITLEAIPGHASPMKTRNMDDIVINFSKNSVEKIKNYTKKVNKLIHDGKKAIVWGMGSKGITFLNLVDKNGFIEFGVDINPRKEGKFISSTGQNIVAPEFLKEYKPDVVFVMNMVYMDEIRSKLEQLNVSPKLIGV